MDCTCRPTFRGPTRFLPFRLFEVLLFQDSRPLQEEVVTREITLFSTPHPSSVPGPHSWLSIRYPILHLDLVIHPRTTFR